MYQSRIPYSTRMKQELEEILVKGKAMELSHPLDAFLRQGARYMIQTALEHELEEFLGRGHYQRGKRRRDGLRNGYEPRGFKTPMGILTVGAPQARATGRPFHSQLLDHLDGDANDALSRLALGMYVRGMSDRDIEDLWVEAFGRQVLSKSAASEVSKSLGKEFSEWRTRDLSAIKPLYLFLDAIFLPVRRGRREKEGVLAAYCITEDGKKVLLHLALGSRESYEDWVAFAQDMASRGLGVPLLVISDGRPGLIKAIGEMWPDSIRQRCQVHKIRNILGKLPKKAMAQIKSLVNQVFHAGTYEDGMKLGRRVIERFKDIYPSAMECLEQDLPACLAYLKFPKEHAKVIRTTNLMERTFGEARRRTKVIPRFPTEKSCLSLVFSVLIRASQKWRGLRITPKIGRELDRLRAQIRNPRPLDMAQKKNSRPGALTRVRQMPFIRDSEKMRSNGELVGVR